MYHTSLVFGGVEYFFGRGIQQAVPGMTFHGEPLEILHMGTSELPIEVIIEYMESLAGAYTEQVCALTWSASVGGTISHIWKPVL